jgi:hypothetical protein
MPFVSFSDCKKCAVNLPSLDTQKQVCEISALRDRERHLAVKLELLKDQFIGAVTMRLVINK